MGGSEDPASKSTKSGDGSIHTCGLSEKGNGGGIEDAQGVFLRQSLVPVARRDAEPQTASLQSALDHCSIRSHATWSTADVQSTRRCSAKILHVYRIHVF